MAQCVIPGLKVAGVAATVPAYRADNLATARDTAEARKFISLTGVETRHVALDGICSSDLCTTAARDLLRLLQWDATSVDALVFVTQTADYLQPSNAFLAHRDLGLSLDCASFEVNLGCSGYPYGLWIASQLLHSGSAQRVLLLHGETPSKVTHPDDTATHMLFGDAGSATGLTRDPAGAAKWAFTMHTDGTGFDDLIVPGRGCRMPSPQDDRDNYLYMKGTNIFNFTLKRVPKLVKDALATAELELDSIDRFFFHQANLFMLKHLMKKVGVAPERAPLTIREHGNTGGVSVPLTIAKHYLENPLQKTEQTMLLGFGIGLSWGAATLDLAPDTVFHFSELMG